MKISVLASGSKGNCFYITHLGTTILIDAGVTYKYYCECLSELRLDPQRLDAIFISHEHGDHVNGAGVMHRKTNAPIYLSEPTMMYSLKKIGTLNAQPINFDIGKDVVIKDLTIHPFTSSHDAIDSCHFLVHPTGDRTKTLAVVTDCGYPTTLLKENLIKSSTIILESNHDVYMLKTGPYDWHLKQRILSKTGHLSNDQANELIKKIYHPNIRRIVLAHLSETNNTPEIAYTQMRETLLALNAKAELHVAGQDKCTELFEV